MHQNQAPVIIVGSSVVGLSAALCLSTNKVPSIVLEKHAGISKHPRAIGFTSRTLEIFHSLGIDEEIPEIPEGFSLVRARIESLAGKWFECTFWQDTGDKKKPSEQEEKKSSRDDTTSPKIQYSPSRGAAIPQDRLEAILEAAALKRGVDIRRQHTVVSVDQDLTGITVTVTNAQGETSQLRGSYLIAADGNRSSIREQLSIGRHGRGHMQTMRSVLFRAPLDEYTRDAQQFNIDQPDLKAFLTTYADGRWALMFYDDIERDEKALRSAIHAAIGRSDVPVEIITTGRWELSALIADTFRSGRIFLAGDAAHTLPPNRGGYGANTGIHDVDNLAWKLAAVLSGKSTPELLNTYVTERRPVAQLRHDQIFVRSDYKMRRSTEVGAGELIDDDAMEFGQIYKSKGFIDVDDNLPPAKKPDEWAGQPGTHMPHFWATNRDGKKVSIHHIVGRQEWTLVSETEEWANVVAQVNERSSVKVQLIQIGGRDVQLADREVFRNALGLSDKGASLIRPDGYIAWRITDMPPEPVGVLNAVLAQVAFTTSS